VQLTGLILFVSSVLAFIYRVYRVLSIRKLLYLVPKKELNREYAIAIVLFMVIAISAGMVWG